MEQNRQGDYTNHGAGSESAARLPPPTSHLAHRYPPRVIQNARKESSRFYSLGLLAHVRLVAVSGEFG